MFLLILFAVAVSASIGLIALILVASFFMYGSSNRDQSLVDGADAYNGGKDQNPESKRNP